MFRKGGVTSTYKFCVVGNATKLPRMVGFANVKERIEGVPLEFAEGLESTVSLSSAQQSSLSLETFTAGKK